MANWTGVLGGGAVGVAVALAGYMGLSVSGLIGPQTPQNEPAALVTPEPANEPEAPVPDPSDKQPEVAAAPAPDVEASPAAEPEQSPAPLTPPTFGLRLDTDGAAIVAGEGAPRSQIVIFLDDAEIAETVAGRDGKFASLMDIAPSPQPRVLTVAMRVDAQEVFSDTEIIVAPFGPPPAPVDDDVVVAEAGDAAAEPEPPQSDDPVTATREAAEEVSGNDIAERAPEATSEEPVVAEAEVSPAEEAPAEDSGVPLAEAEEPVPEQQQPSAEEEIPVSTPAEAAQDEAQPAVAEEPADVPEDRVAGAEVSGDETARAPAEAPADEPAGPVAEVPAEEEPVEPQDVANVAAEAPADAADAAPVTEAEKTELAEAPADEVAPDMADGATAEAAVSEEEVPPTLLASDEEGVRVLPGPEVLDRVAIDTISYDDAGDVALAGRGAGSEGGGFVRVYLDNTPITTSRIREDGSWRVKLPEVDKGVYTLRVDEVDDEGEVKSRAETPFQREDRETLEAASEGADGGPVKIVTVQPGNTLWQIARERYGEGILYVRVFDANRGQIRDPDLIYPGQVFDLPEDQAASEKVQEAQ